MTKLDNGTVHPSSFIDLFLRVNDLKTVSRTGWVREEINNPETLAEHIFSLSFLTMQLASELSERLHYPLNKGKLIKLALIHDIGELEVGDIVTSRGTKIDLQKKEEKERKERQSIKKLFKNTDPTNFSLSLFEELIERETMEAKLLWQLDKLDRAIQALYYEIKERKDLSEFFDNAKSQLTDPFLIELLDEVISRRPGK